MATCAPTPPSPSWRSNAAAAPPPRPSCGALEEARADAAAVREQLGAATERAQGLERAAGAE
ncbi:hypothetical protein [Actinomadura nitritigenes]|uniref:hypothetical protein n=1 Tax=Actinomadura nitritigenes TaxID=134602 RepID=UPI0031D7C57B